MAERETKFGFGGGFLTWMGAERWWRTGSGNPFLGFCICIWLCFYCNCSRRPSNYELQSRRDKFFLFLCFPGFPCSLSLSLSLSVPLALPLNATLFSPFQWEKSMKREGNSLSLRCGFFCFLPLLRIFFLSYYFAPLCWILSYSNKQTHSDTEMLIGPTN